MPAQTPTAGPWPERSDIDTGYRDPYDPRDDLPPEPADLDARDLEPLDELAVDAARDYCQTCGRFRPDGSCLACGGEES